jgi:hypothetical protein
MSERYRVAQDLLLLFAVALVVRALVAWPIEQPGYMDAAYYVDGALALHQGRGFNLPLIWNYLSDDPVAPAAAAAELPVPSHLYWMPLTSIAIATSFAVLGPTFRAAQIPLILLSALVPALAYLVAYKTSRTTAPDEPARARRHGFCAGLLALFSGFYTAYWVAPDSFALFAIVGALCLWALGRAWEPRPTPDRTTWLIVAGLCAGLAHLTRADGVLLLLTGLLVGAYALLRLVVLGAPRKQTGRLFRDLAIYLACYLIVMVPWFGRNLRVVGRPLSTAGVKTAWLTSYDDLFSYGKPLTLETYLSWGWNHIVRSKLHALWLNAQTVLVVGWMIALVPLGMLGAWRLRRQAAFRIVGLYGALLYLTMSLVFTFPGWRGGMQHSTTALLPALYAAAMEGLDCFVDWIARRRKTWQPRQAKRVLGGGLILIALALSAWIYTNQVDRFKRPHLYEQVTAWMDQYAPQEVRVMVNDPALFYYHSRRASLAIPNADLDTVLTVMNRYEVRYLLLDVNNPSLRALYLAPESNDRLKRIKTFENERTTAHLFQRTPGPNR